MNAAQLAQRLLVYVDQRTLSEANTAGAEYLNSAVDAINSAAQELYRIVPSIAIRNYGLTTRPMQTLAATMAQHSNQAALTAYQSWMLGQSVSGTDYKGRVTASPIPTGNMIVAGAGDAAINGIYALFGTSNGKPSYRNAATNNFISWQVPANHWLIGANKYVSTQDVATPDLATFLVYVPLGGAAPAPTVTAEVAITLTSQAAIAQSSLNIYNDAIPLPVEITMILPDVVLDNRALLVPASSELELNSIIRTQKRTDYGRPRPVRNQPYAPAPGIPTAYMVDTIATSGSASAPTRYMRLSPWPTNVHTISFNARIAPVAIATADLDAANNGAACTKEVPVPNGWDETYLLPIALQHFTMSPFWNNTGAAAEIRRRYEWTLQTLTLANPQGDRPIDLYPAL